MTLVAAYERLIGGRGTEIKPGEPAPPVPVKLPVILHPTPPADVPTAAAPPATPVPARAAQERRKAAKTKRGANRIPAPPGHNAMPPTGAGMRPTMLHDPTRSGCPAIPAHAALWLALGATASLALGGSTRAAQSPAFARWVAGFPRPRDQSAAFRQATYDRVMNALTPDTSVLARVSRAAGIHRTGLAVHQPPLLGLARHHRQGARQGICRPAGAHREGLRRRPLHHARPVGHGVLVRRRHRQSEIHAAGDPGARRARLGRAAPAPLLGSRTAQRADHRRPRLGTTGRHDRLLGRRHGPHPMDAGGVAAHGRRLRP